MCVMHDTLPIRMIHQRLVENIMMDVVYISVSQKEARVATQYIVSYCLITGIYKQISCENKTIFISNKATHRCPNFDSDLERPPLELVQRNQCNQLLLF